jgi:uncharacterized protein
MPTEASSSLPGATKVVISHRVKPEREAEFMEWSMGIAMDMAKAPGFLDCETIPPMAGAQEEWVSVFHFDTREHVGAWILSDTRAGWLVRLEPLLEAPWRTRVTGGLDRLLGILPPDQAAPPNVWKLALLTELGLWPTAWAVTVLLTDLWRTWHLGLQVLLSTLVCISLMTWVVMPALTRACHGWLQPGTRLPR